MSFLRDLFESTFVAYAEEVCFWLRHYEFSGLSTNTISQRLKPQRNKSLRKTKSLLLKHPRTAKKKKTTTKRRKKRKTKKSFWTHTMNWEKSVLRLPHVSHMCTISTSVSKESPRKWRSQTTPTRRTRRTVWKSFSIYNTALTTVLPPSCSTNWNKLHVMELAASLVYSIFVLMG